MPTTEETVSSTGVDETIGRIENLYRTVTGNDPPPIGDKHSPIPVERDPARHVEEQLDRLLSALGPMAPGLAAPSWSPLITIWENEVEYLVCADLPGVTRKDVEVTLHGGVLTIRGQRPSAHFHEYRLRAGEGLLGAFARKVLLPPAVREVEPNAQIKDGVLEIRILKENTPPSGPRSIPVN